MNIQTSYLCKVPVELWEEIFMIVSVPSSKEYTLIIKTESLNVERQVVTIVPFTLMHVCSHQSEITTRCPMLWASINVALWHKYFERRQKLVEMFLANSAPCPLNLKVGWHYSFPDCAQDTWEILKSHFSRSEQLFLNSAWDFGMHLLNPSCGQDITFENLLYFHTQRGGLSGISKADIDHPFSQALRRA
ncbi:hypothetical protein E1B28_003604 [Marasmius oreades]|uniref:F-box domain-containing protein n=1 Tax=Marasmius oreades TaxID=181124 RepID=A0A9P7UNL0_9AGAR|nr:uncharacterized protein E1B28_003604 [Marasmius oreades]KAG7086089.1 hypothetical protein E1B28_003604 [Marasmius oreades]